MLIIDMGRESETKMYQKCLHGLTLLLSHLQRIGQLQKKFHQAIAAH